MRTMIWATVCVLALVPAGCAESHKQSQEQAQLRYEVARSKIHFQLAKNAYDNGKLGQCKEQLGKTLCTSQPYVPALLLAAKVAVRERRFSEAHDFIEAAVRTAPDSPDAWCTKALLDEHDGDLDAALDAMTRAQVLDPNDPEYLLLLAEMQVRRGEIDRALCTLTAVEARFASHAGFQSALADLHMMKSNDGAAVLCLRRVARLDPSDEGARERLALCLVWCGQPEQAVPMLEGLLAKRRYNSMALQCAVADGYVQLGQYAKAEASYARLCRVQPNNPDWNLRLAECYAMQNDDRAATERVDHVLSLAPGRADARALAGYLRYANGELEKAAAHLRVAIDRADTPGLVAVLLVKTLRGLGRDTEADEVWAEYGNAVELALQQGYAGRMAVVPTTSFVLTGQLPQGATRR